MRVRARETPAALLLLLVGCVGGGEAARREVDVVRAEVRALRKDNEDLARRLDALAGRVEVISTRLSRNPAAPPPAAAKEPTDQAPAPVIPSDLAVVRVEPTPQRAARTPPPVPTAVAIGEPDPARLEALSRRSGRDIGAEADGELRRARQRAGGERARSLEEFAKSYPRHPAADNALVEASAAHAEGGRAEAACELARRAADEYPAGDAVSEALERLAWCEARRGARDAERRLLERLVSEFPRTPAARRAGTRLATISGHAGEAPESPARSAP